MCASAPLFSVLPREPGQVVSRDYANHGTLHYAAEAREIVGRNRPHFNNRPLYCLQNTEGAVLAGDRPFVRLVARPFVHGALSIALARAHGPVVWLHAFTEVESRYRCGRMRWICTDPRFPDTVATLTIVPLRDQAGLAAHLSVSGATDQHAVIWAFAGAQPDDDPRLNWDPVMRGNPDICRSGDPRKPLLAAGPQPDASRGNLARASGRAFFLAGSAQADRGAAGSVSCGEISIGDASAYADPAALFRSRPAEAPLVCGRAPLSSSECHVFWRISSAPANASLANFPADASAEAFRTSLDYLRELESATTATPDAHLDAAVAAVAHAIDGACERGPAIFRHGAMAFNIRFIGWRVIGGATALGWHERVRENAFYYLARQKTADDARTRPAPDEIELRTHESKQSRVFGRGSFPRDGYEIYDVQSQFFDQTIRDWRYTHDPALAARLRPALELHTEWLRECFDPDDDGLYESYINTLPTDSVWYNGGGSVEASAYAATAHRAAMDLARLDGDLATAERHRAQLEKIQAALRTQLWLPDRGHFGLYREQGGLARVHVDAWTYSVFLPIDLGFVTPIEALQSLYYTEWALERVRLPFGGELCVPSNWVPWKWSVRDVFGGDVWHLALAYFRTQLGDEGYRLLRGALLESAYASAVPGGFSHIGAGTDFADNTHMFARCIVEGLFGFEPDYPNGVVHLRPAFPTSWPRASLATPDFRFEFEQHGERDVYRLQLTRAAAVAWRVPVHASSLQRVTVDGSDAPFSVEPGFGCAFVTVRTPSCAAVELALHLGPRVPFSEPLHLTGDVGETTSLLPSHGTLRGWRDLHGVLATPRIEHGALRAQLGPKPGHHLVLLECVGGELPRWQTVKLCVTDQRAEADRARRTPRAPASAAHWSFVDLAPHLNGDIRTIFQQRYLSPRPNTCSVRLGVDGYSAWTFHYWRLPPPDIDLSGVDAARDSLGRLVTSERVPFVFPATTATRNILFTSRWDNWPTSATIPVDDDADTAWLLVCGTTFPMQTRIANAVVRFTYRDGASETLELVPPFNFWMMCPWGGEDYSYVHDAFALPAHPPPQVQLGRNCRAIVLSWKLRPGVALATITLETLSPDVVIGLMAVSLEHS